MKMNRVTPRPSLSHALFAEIFQSFVNPVKISLYHATGDHTFNISHDAYIAGPRGPYSHPPRKIGTRIYHETSTSY